MNKFLGGIVAAAAVAVALPAFADDFAFGFSAYNGTEALSLNGGATTIGTAKFQGWVSDTAGNSAGPDGSNTNYIVGTINSSNYRDFFVFDISGLSDPVSSAALSIYSFTSTQNLTYELFDASAVASQLHDSISPNPGLYDAMASGLALGSFGVGPGTDNQQLTFNLNAAGVNALNTAISNHQEQFAIAGSVTGAGTGAVPEPATWALMIGGFGLAGASLRRRRAALLTA